MVQAGQLGACQHMDKFMSVSHKKSSTAMSMDHSNLHLLAIASRAGDVTYSTELASSVLRLPDEMLMIVFSYLDQPSDSESARGWIRGDTRPVLCALALTCKRLSRIASEFMLREVKLATGHVSSLYSNYTMDRLSKFIRTCNENVHIVNRIRSLQMQCDFSATPDWGATPGDKVPDEVLQVVSESSTLESLSILLPGATFLSWLPSLTDGSTRFTHLQSLYLDCGSIPIHPSTFASMCLLPSLKHIETKSPVRISILRFNMDPQVPAPIAHKCKSSVETIKMTDLVSESSGLCSIASSMPMLRTLCTSMAGPGLRFDDHEATHHKGFPNTQGGQFSPHLQQILLRPLLKTLHSLSIISSRVLVKSHDGTFLDLAAFKKLEHLKISIHHLCWTSLQNARRLAQADPPPCKPHRDFLQLLPPNLVTLEIHYDSDQGIFYDPHHVYTAYYIEGDPEHTYMPRNTPKKSVLGLMYQELWTKRISQLDGKDGVRDRLDWLVTLREAKHVKFPRLKNVCVRETYARDWTWKDFDLVERHPVFFSAWPFDVEVVLRVPRTWDPPAPFRFLPPSHSEVPEEFQIDEVQGWS